jgi:hypothetical protein
MHSRPKDGVLSHTYVRAITVFSDLPSPKTVDARDQRGHDELEFVLSSYKIANSVLRRSVTSMLPG